MNKRQKELLQLQLDNEKAVLKKLQGIYKKALDDVNNHIAALMGRTDSENLQSIVYQLNYQKALKTQINGILDNLASNQYTTISEYLANCYENGFIGTMYDIHGQGIPLLFPLNQDLVVRAVQNEAPLVDAFYDYLGEDVNLLKKRVANNISRGMAQGSSYAEIARNIERGMIGDYSKVNGGAMYDAYRIARTEGHRITNAATHDAQIKAKDAGADVVKQWDAAMDRRTRKSHARVDGEIREIDDTFSNGLMYPGDSAGSAAEVINCRCACLQRAKWALDDDELQMLEARAEFFGLDKTENFEDFKQKYLKAAESVAITPITAEEQKAYLQKFLRDKNQTGTSKPVTIGGMDVTVTKAPFGFHDGRGGVKKTVDAVIYETQSGTKFVFPKSYNKANQQMTPEQAISLWSQVPADIRRQAQKTIQFVDYYNPQDSYWKKMYKNFGHSYATGGQTITFYRYDYPHNDAYVINTYCHEAGHFIDTNRGTNGRFSSEAPWTKAMADDIVVSGKKSCTVYGENSATEDFAESVAEYVKDKTRFEKNFPNRAAILATIISI